MHLANGQFRTVSSLCYRFSIRRLWLVPVLVLATAMLGYAVAETKRVFGFRAPDELCCGVCIQFVC